MKEIILNLFNISVLCFNTNLCVMSSVSCVSILSFHDFPFGFLKCLFKK